MKPSLIWFKTDLRIHDNPALAKACQLGGECLGVYILDPKELKPSPQVLAWGMDWPRLGANRARFLYESLINLKENMQALGSDLVIALGNPQEVIPTLVEAAGIHVVIASEEVCPEEVTTIRNVSNALQDLSKKRGVGVTPSPPLSLSLSLSLTAPNLVFSPLPKTRGVSPTVFSPFRRLITKNPPQRVDDTPLTNLTIPKAWVTGGKESFQKTYPTPAPKDFSKDISGDFSKDFSKDLSLDPPITSFPWEGGETTGLKRAKYYNQTSKGILNYRSTRNEISGEDFSTKFSPWLAHGCLSARLVYEQASTRGKKENKGYAIQKFLDEMTWREFFWHVARDHSPQFFQPAGLLGKARPNKFDLQKFNSWKDGTTKSPLINAFMRELASTGFMSNRGRQVVASYLIHDLSQPWTAGAWWFQHALIDFDPTQNWGNWLHASGVGTDPVPNRKFNPYLQAQKYDPMGDFQRGWGVSKAIYKAVGVTHTTQTLHPQPHPHPLLPLAYND